MKALAAILFWEIYKVFTLANLIVMKDHGAGIGSEGEGAGVSAGTGMPAAGAPVPGA